MKKSLTLILSGLLLVAVCCFMNNVQTASMFGRLWGGKKQEYNPEKIDAILTNYTNQRNAALNFPEEKNRDMRMASKIAIKTIPSTIRNIKNSAPGAARDFAIQTARNYITIANTTLFSSPENAPTELIEYFRSLIDQLED